ncbi:hypothetical protein G6L29_31260 [Agrobacterium rhizogenes]|nr:hypothetical protein [Rhizobium rhizogenes]NTG71581.1 hypothetical protein [Rhizobium rhizogenes]NTG84481.1 hypothetical protein [Rhizobium rhizogenes]NTG90872.1 hypothetical protein [Rhizobium rhizogenes]NTH29759.1 hypothetical protein [Rhizobium rhizogenes]
MKFTLYRLSVWSGLLVVIGSVLAYTVVSPLTPPPPPSWGAKQVSEFLFAHRTNILWSVVIMGFFAPFFYFFAVITSQQMARIEGGWGVLSFLQLTTAVVAPTGWIYPLAMIATAVYRPDRDPNLVLMFNDLYWLTYVGVAFIFSINIASIGLAALWDRRQNPVFTRWFGWANIAFAIIFAPGIFVYPFMDGPFAWDGLFANIIPSIAFLFWKAMMITMLLRAVKSEEKEEAAALKAATLKATA